MRSEKQSIRSARLTGDFATDESHLHPRARLDVPVVVHSNASKRATITKLSRSGAVLSTDEPPAKGELVELEVRSPADDVKLRVLGEVRWHRAAVDAAGQETIKIGVAFQNLGDEGLSHLLRIVDARR